MSELSQMLRWNANFVRGLAQSVLERARVIRGSLKAETSQAFGLKAKVKSVVIKKAKKVVKRAAAQKSKGGITRKTKRANA